MSTTCFGISQGYDDWLINRFMPKSYKQDYTQLDKKLIRFAPAPCGVLPTVGKGKKNYIRKSCLLDRLV